MEEAIKNFAKQFEFKPIVENKPNLKKHKSFVVGGMGGSHLPALILKMQNSGLDIYVHNDYGLPELHEKFKGGLFIASSYSGNTEETVDFAEKALVAKYSVAVIALKGKLIELAKKNNLPYVQLPDTGIQPRNALGFSLVALVKLMGDEALAGALLGLAKKINPLRYEAEGRTLAETLAGKVPVIYSSKKNISIAYNWKIKFNETAKIPAFYNVFPELNHNEMTSFDVTKETGHLSGKFYFIFIADNTDHPKNKRRMEITKKFYEDRGLPVTIVSLSGDDIWTRTFTNLLVADWTALHISKAYGTEAERVPMVEEFKKLIA